MAAAGTSRLAPTPAGPDEDEVPFHDHPAAVLLPPSGCAALPGHPSDSSYRRLNRSRASFTGGYWQSLALGVSVLLRCSRCTTPLTAAWLLAYCLLAAASLVWRRARPASHERWREVPAVLLGLLSFGLGLGWMQTRRLLDEIGERSLSAADSGGGGGEPALDLVRHAAFIAFASGAVGMGALAVSLRARFSMCLPVWLTVAATAAPFARNVCAAAALSNPAAQRANHCVYGVASMLGYVPLPVALMVRPSASDECTTLLVALQFWAGALVPLLANGLAEARQFQHHQRQRWQARLPLERGLQAAAYDSLWWATLGGDRGATSLVFFLLLCAVWSLSALLCSQASP